VKKKVRYSPASPIGERAVKQEAARSPMGAARSCQSAGALVPEKGGTMTRLIALIVLSILLVVISFRSDLRDFRGQFAREHASRAIAIMARHTV
jgi:hypothetical protein